MSLLSRKHVLAVPRHCVLAVILNAVKDPEKFHAPQPLEPFNPSVRVFAIAFGTTDSRRLPSPATPKRNPPPHKQPQTHHDPPSTHHKFTIKKPHQKPTKPRKIATSTIANI
jgi:hypothetical protein